MEPNQNPTTPEGQEPKTPEGQEPNGTPPTPAGEDPAVLKGKLEKSVQAEKSLREKLRKLEAEAAERAKKDAEEQGKWKDLYSQAEPKLKAAEELEAIVKGVVEAETAGLTPEQKATIDALPATVGVQARLQLAKQFGAANAAAKAAAAPAPGTTPPAPKPGTTTPATAPRPPAATGDKRVWTEEEIASLSFKERQEKWSEITEAARDGRIRARGETA